MPYLYLVLLRSKSCTSSHTLIMVCEHPQNFHRTPTSTTERAPRAPSNVTNTKATDALESWVVDSGGGGVIYAKYDAMRFGIRLATLTRRGGGVTPLRTTEFSQTAPRGGHLGRGRMCIYPFLGHAEGNLRVLCFKSDGHLLFHICSVAGTRWPKGLPYSNGGLHSTSSLM